MIKMRVYEEIRVLYKRRLSKNCHSDFGYLFTDSVSRYRKAGIIISNAVKYIDY